MKGEEEIYLFDYSNFGQLVEMARAEKRLTSIFKNV